jgi:hypothetical protein
VNYLSVELNRSCSVSSRSPYWKELKNSLLFVAVVVVVGESIDLDFGGTCMLLPDDFQ